MCSLGVFFVAIGLTITTVHSCTSPLIPRSTRYIASEKLDVSGCLFIGRFDWPLVGETLWTMTFDILWKATLF